MPSRGERSLPESVLPSGPKNGGPKPLKKLMPVDMFDCVLPTRNGRTGQAFTSKGKVNVKNARWATDTDPLDENCGCQVCRRHSRAYLRHLYVSGEMLASILLTHHNLAFFLDTMKGVRQAIRSGEFTNFRHKFTESLNASDESN